MSPSNKHRRKTGVIKRKFLKCLTQVTKSIINTRSYSGSYTISDHRLVITTVVISWSQVWKKKNRGNKDKKMKIDTQKPVYCPEIKTKYKKIRRKIKQSS